MTTAPATLADRARAYVASSLLTELDAERHRTPDEIASKLSACAGCDFFRGQTCLHASMNGRPPFWRALVWRQLDCPVGRWDEALPLADRAIPLPLGGPGTELKAMLAELGIHDWHDCGCSDMAAQMDLWGVAGCEENRPGIVLHLQTKARERGWGDLLAAGWRSVTSGMLLRLSLSDLYGSLVDEAIRRATISWETRMAAGELPG
jgi:hypothetical protein